MNVYVYYKVEAGRREPVRVAVGALFAALEAATGVRGRWMHRRDDPATHMEVYEGIADAEAFEHALAAAVEGSGAAALTTRRITEIFQEA